MYEVLDQVIIACDKNATDIVFNETNWLDSMYNITFHPIPPKKNECVWTIYDVTDVESYDQIFVLDEFGSIMDFNLSDNDSITISASGESYPSGMYEIRDFGVRVWLCKFELHFIESSILVNVISVCYCISVPLLIVLLVLGWNSRQAKLQRQLITSVLLCYTIVLIASSVENPNPCTAAAIFLNYALFAVFIWMNVIVVDAWLVSKPRGSFSPLNAVDRSYLFHLILGWGISLMLVVVPTLMNYVEVDERFKPQFGGIRCWYRQRYAMILYFAIPSALSVTITFIFLILSCVNFKRAQHQSLSRGGLFAPSVGYFIVMTTTWVFGFVSEFTHQLIIKFIFVILMLLQGLFLFILFLISFIRFKISEIGEIQTSSNDFLNEF